DEAIIEAIRAEKSPMGAKFKAKANKAHMVIEPRCSKDIENMRICLVLKIEYHPELKQMLAETKDELIVEGCSQRSDRFWGQGLEDGKWVGENWLGRIWMDMRENYLEN